MTDTVLIVDNTAYRGWQGITVTRSLFTLAGAIELQVADAWQGGAQLPHIAPGAAFALHHGDHLVLQGHIDGREIDYDDQRHTVNLIGRDAGGDLVDCSAFHGSGQWQQVALGTVVRDLVSDYLGPPSYGPGVDATTLVDFAIEQGETINDALQRLLAPLGVVMMILPSGRLHLTRTGTEPAEALVLGENVKRGAITSSVAERYYRYQVASQLDSAAWPNATLTAAAQPFAEVLDTGVRKPRRLVIYEDYANTSQCRQRATFERALRSGRGDTLRYTTAGWQQRSGQLWQINQRCPVRDRYLNIDTELLIAGVTLRLDGNGYQSELALVQPEVFNVPVQPVSGLQGSRWSNAQP